MDHGGNPAQDIAFQVRKPDQKELEKQKLVAALMMALPGAPMIYYGDECGMWGGDDPDCRKPMIWPELAYEPEAAHPFAKERPVDPVNFDKDLYLWYKKLIAIRKKYPVLSIGSISFYPQMDSAKILVFDRDYEDQKLKIVVNNQNVEYRMTADDLNLTANMMELVAEKKINLEKSRSEFTLKPYQLMILRSEGGF
jgi:glycosidase